MKKAKTKKPRFPTSFKWDDDLKAAVLARAAKENRTLSNLIVTALKQYLEN